MIAPEMPRGWDTRYWTVFRRRVDALHARADRGSAKEKARLERAAKRLQLVAEHGTLMADLIEQASAPFDLSAVTARRSGVRKFRPKPTSTRYEPRGFVATAGPDGRFTVTDPSGAPVPNVFLTASGAVIELARK